MPPRNYGSIFILSIILISLCSSEQNSSRILVEKDFCDASTRSREAYKLYFRAITKIYENLETGTCIPVHKECGWPKSSSKLPLFVLSVGLEGAGHHLWTELLDKPVFDCVWKNARHYQRDVADGVPRTTAKMLEDGLREQLQFRVEKGLPACRSIYDSEDSFPTGAIRKSGRLFMRPDIVNLQKLDGILFNIKYIIILRNVTDTAMSALRRNFFQTADEELRTVEHTLTYLEAAMRGVACHKTFIAHYEHVLSEPSAYIGPLTDFLELSESQKKVLESRLSYSPKSQGTASARKKHKLTQFQECKSKGLSPENCYEMMKTLLDQFFNDRTFLWPTFAGNGFDYNKKN